MMKDAAVPTVPYGFEPRPYQADFFEAMDNGINRALLIWPRRAGKDLSMWNWVIMQAVQRVGSYVYVFPFKTHARKNVWDAKDNEGRRFLDYVPEQILAKPVNNTQMRIELRNGSDIRLEGSDNFDALRGANGVLYVFSEWAYSNPAAFDVVRPIIKANGGKVAFNTTVNGMNHCYKNFNEWGKSDRWYVDLKTAVTLVNWDGSRIITDKMLDEEREDGMHEDKLQREYFNKWDANADGYILLKEMNEATKSGRIADYAYDPNVPVITGWDIGFDDCTAIWFGQLVHGYLRLIDYHEENHKQLPYYVKFIKEKPYTYSHHFWPHDGVVHDWSGEGDRKERASTLGLEVTTVPKLPLWDSIDIMRVGIKSMQFDAVNAQGGVNCLLGYMRKYNRQTQQYTNAEERNFATHGASALRTLMLGINKDGLLRSGGLRKKRGNIKGYSHDKRTLRTKKSWKSA